MSHLLHHTVWDHRMQHREAKENTASSLSKLLLSKLNVRSFMCVNSLFVNLTGCFLIYMGVKSDGFIDVKTTFVEGRLETGMVGLLVVFIGMIISLAVLRPPSGKTIEIDLPDGRKVYLRGVNSMRETLRVLHPLVTASSEGAAATPRLAPD